MDIHTKFNKGDQVFFINGSSIAFSYIAGLKIIIDYSMYPSIMYTLTGTIYKEIGEKFVYESKEALIASL